ncbi:CCR4-NOT transcription complex subunit 3 [Trypanosoma conorhini]|uniref:CCR4-NOT transcription complex subunit 3 n=1 Tax=Trypanosoma conorhini TaxID=83891 RepID=A0A3R7NKE7_9TRYP|nr:CCR4-NOT transcription complex subunit 3 [Trypanosoma conorhini]RNF23305.1 CCR4-NOT transcription complex subunit 3 [Trypanosoma conorhini]
MANSKKVQQEVDRLLRRTQDGIDSYEVHYTKFLKADTPQSKARLEGELKKEIKKLQRFRDSIKAMIATPEVKDTKALESYQRNIEEKMEVFKSCERETKTKAYSKEALLSASPHKTPQAHTEAWLKACMDDARKQIEIIEYDVERNTRGHHGRGKNAVSAEAVRLQKLQFHLGKLEQLLKAVTNGDADLEEVAEIEERVQRFLKNEANSDDDDDDDDDDDEALYSGFDLEENRYEKPRGSGAEAGDDAAAAAAGHEARKKSVTSSPTNTRASSQSAVKKAAAAAAAAAAPAVKAEAAKRPPRASQTAPRAGGTSPLQATKPATSRDSPPEAWEDNAGLLDDEMDKANTDTFGDDAMDIKAPGSLADMAKATSTFSRMGDWEKGRPASLTVPQAAPNTSLAPATAAATASEAIKTANAAAAAAPAAVPPPTIKSQAGEQQAAAAPAASSATPAVAAQQLPASSQPQRTAEHKQQGSAASYPSSYATVSYDKAMMHQLIDMSLGNLPHTQDIDRQRPFEPSNPTDCPLYYPQQVLPALASPDIYREFELETLFFIFYYHQNTYQQYYAAKQIKAQSFRYHTQLNTWFKRNGHMKESQEGSERGSFIFFNYEDTWRIEEKEDFTFEYQYLEDQLR